MTKQRAVILFILLLGFISSLGLIFRGFIHENIIIPLNFLFWTLSRLIHSIDQVIIWLFFIFIFLVMMMRSLANRPQPKEFEPAQPKWNGTSRKQLWLTELYLLTNSKIPSRYPVHEIRKLFLTVVAYAHHLDIQETEEALKAGQLDIPPGIWKRLDFEEEPAPKRFNLREITHYYLEEFRSFRNRFLTRPINTDHPRLKNLRGLLDIMEDQLEIKHDR